MAQKYEPEFRRKMALLHLQEGRTYESITQEYGVLKSAISNWVDEYSKECQTKAEENPTAQNEPEIMKIEEQEKEISFLKKAAAFFAKEMN